MRCTCCQDIHGTARLFIIRRSRAAAAFFFIVIIGGTAATATAARTAAAVNVFTVNHLGDIRCGVPDAGSHADVGFSVVFVGPLRSFVQILQIIGPGGFSVVFLLTIVLVGHSGIVRSQHIAAFDLLGIQPITVSGDHIILSCRV